MSEESFRAIVPDTSPEILSWRIAAGKNLYDEVWEGVYHIVEEKSRIQHELENELENWLTIHWAVANGGRVFRDTRLAKDRFWERAERDIDFRVPSICLYRSMSSTAYVNQTLVEPPDVVIEVFDEKVDTTLKADYYRRLGVPEIWLVDAMTLICDLILCRNGRWISTISNQLHPVVSTVTGIQIGIAMEANENRIELKWVSSNGGQVMPSVCEKSYEIAEKKRKAK